MIYPKDLSEKGYLPSKSGRQSDLPSRSGRKGLFTLTVWKTQSDLPSRSGRKELFTLKVWKTQSDLLKSLEDRVIYPQSVEDTE